MDHILEFFHSEHDEDLLYFEIHILQYWLVVAPPSKFNIVYTVLFHKYVGSNVSVKSCMSHFSMFVPTKATVKLANGNTAHAQKLGLFYVVSLTVPLYIQWDQFIIFQVTLPTPYHHHILSGRITGDGPFNHNQLIWLEWCLDLEKIQS